MRAVIYARYSTDMQNIASIADQLRACRRHAERIGAAVVDEYSDAAISGTSRAKRPDLRRLMQDAANRRFDVVIAEDLDRLARSGGDSWDIFDDLDALGISINTIAQGAVTDLHVGMSGTMSQLLIKQIAQKTWRGLEGVAREGRHAGGNVFGYRIKRELTAEGQLVAGLLEINPQTAPIVVRILREFAAGVSPRAIAGALNTEGLPSPRGGLWNASTIYGNAKRGNGIVHNELYAGVLVWGRQTFKKNRRTGARTSSLGAAERVVRTPVPHLRIADAELWSAVRARYEEIRQAPRPEQARRPKRLLSGLIRCGECDGPMIVAGSGGRIVCSVRREKGVSVCGNGRTAVMADVEARVLTRLRETLLHPAVVEAAVKEVQLAQRQQASADRAERQELERELEAVKLRTERLLDQVEAGLSGPSIRDRLAMLEARGAELEAQIADLAAAPVTVLHPATADRYRRYVEELQSALDGPALIEREEAKEALRAIISAVVINPLPTHGQYDVTIESDLDQLLGSQTQNRRQVREPGGDLVVTVVAGAGFEPATFRL